MNPIAITLLLAVALAGFGALAWRKLAIVVKLAPEVRWDHPLARLQSVLVNGFLQSRMVAREWKPGVMHAVIFLGFMTLLVRKVQLLVIGYDETFVYPGLAGGMFASFKDLVELAVLAAVGYALWRRLAQKPARLERNREALVILSLIAAIMVTDFLFDGFRFALKVPADPGIAHERSFAFAGDAIARTVFGTVAGPAGRRIPGVVLDTNADGAQLSGDPARRRALPHRHRAAHALFPARRAGQPRAGDGPGSDHERERCE